MPHVGTAGLRFRQKQRKDMQEAGKEVNRRTVEALKGQLATFKSNLEEFAAKHKDSIKKDPDFRSKFHTMCTKIGVDPFSSKKTKWNALLGLGDFYYELSVQVVEACLRARDTTGGLLELQELHRRVQRRRNTQADPASFDDIVRAIDGLKSLGGGASYRIVTLGKAKYLRSVPTELSTDGNAVLALAGDRGGFFTRREAAAELGWVEERLGPALSSLAAEGLLLIDDQHDQGGKERLYWVPAVGIEASTAEYKKKHLGR
jgi:ESCRT-II complex subunit VPS22